MRKLPAATGFAILSAFVVSGAHAQTVNKWVDEEGTTHYSNRKPAAAETGVNKIEVPAAGTAKTETEEVNSRINNQLQKMQQERRSIKPK